MRTTKFECPSFGISTYIKGMSLSFPEYGTSNPDWWEDKQLPKYKKMDIYGDKECLSGMNVKKNFNKKLWLSLNFKRTQPIRILHRRGCSDTRNPKLFMGCVNFDVHEEHYYVYNRLVTETVLSPRKRVIFNVKTIDDDFLKLKEHTRVIGRWDSEKQIFLLQPTVSEVCFNWYVLEARNFATRLHTRQSRKLVVERLALKNLLKDLEVEIDNFFEFKFKPFGVCRSQENRPETIMFDSYEKARKLSATNRVDLCAVVNSALLAMDTDSSSPVKNFSWTDPIPYRDYFYKYTGFPKKEYRYSTSVIYGLIKELNSVPDGSAKNFYLKPNLPVGESSVLLTKPSGKMDVVVLIKNSFLFFFSGKGRKVFSEKNNVILELIDMCLRETSCKQKNLSKLAQFNLRKIKAAEITLYIDAHFSDMSRAFLQIDYDLSSLRIKYGLNISEFGFCSEDRIIEYFKEGCVVSSKCMFLVYKLHFLKEFARLLRERCDRRNLHE